MAESNLNNSDNNSEQITPTLEQDDHITDTAASLESKEENSRDGSNSITDNANGSLLSWGCGEFGQHGHGHLEDVNPIKGHVENFYKYCSGDGIKGISCGGSHTVVITGM